MVDVLTRREEDGVVYLTMNRPERLNALNPELAARLAEELSNVDESNTAVVLTGDGRAFSAGHDLKAAAEIPEPRTDADLRDSVEKFQDITRALRSCLVPVIGAVRGWAVGAGCELALSCDLVVASDDAQFGFPETGVALIVTNGVTGLLPRTVGSALAKELILLGEFITAERARDLGLINRVVASDQVETVVAEWVARLRTRGPLAVRLSKKLIDDGMLLDIEAAMERESTASVEAEASTDATAKVKAFADRSKVAPSGDAA
jgi:enoyl-CoA hydratase/carnithine racemase